jgi:hypothetical protein
MGWMSILIAIVISNIVQVVFETSLAHSFEVTLKPTYLDKMQSNDKLEEDQDPNPD